jgi:hypothetical protein
MEPPARSLCCARWRGTCCSLSRVHAIISCSSEAWSRHRTGIQSSPCGAVQIDCPCGRGLHTSAARPSRSAARLGHPAAMQCPIDACIRQPTSGAALALSAHVPMCPYRPTCNYMQPTYNSAPGTTLAAVSSYLTPPPALTASVGPVGGCGVGWVSGRRVRDG